MTLGEAFDILTATGCRIVPDDIGGIALDVPPTAPPIPRDLLAVLSANREALVAAFGQTTGEAVAADIAEYLASKRITGASAELVLHAAKLFGVKGQGISVDGSERGGNLFQAIRSPREKWQHAPHKQQAHTRAAVMEGL